VAAGYGIMLFVLAVLWVISYPLLAATLLALIGGASVMVRLGAQITHRRIRRTVCVPGTDVCLTL
jgi:hypothetical protein